MDNTIMICEVIKELSFWLMAGYILMIAYMCWVERVFGFYAEGEK